MSRTTDSFASLGMTERALDMTPSAPFVIPGLTFVIPGLVPGIYYPTSTEILENEGNNTKPSP